MGYNYSCIVIDRNIEGQVEPFLKNNGIFIKPSQKTVPIEKAMDGDQSKEIDAFFTDSGTILFIPNDLSLQCYMLESAEVLTFSYYETAMAFTVFLSKDSKSIREIMEADGEIHLDEGEALPYEADANSISDWLDKKVDAMTGFKMFGYEDDAVCKRFIISADEEIVEEKKVVNIEKKKGFFSRLFSRF